jgi:hypothetical protein
LWEREPAQVSEQVQAQEWELPEQVPALHKVQLSVPQVQV